MNKPRNVPLVVSLPSKIQPSFEDGLFSHCWTSATIRLVDPQVNGTFTVVPPTGVLALAVVTGSTEE